MCNLTCQPLRRRSPDWALLMYKKLRVHLPAGTGTNMIKEHSYSTWTPAGRCFTLLTKFLSTVQRLRAVRQRGTLGSAISRQNDAIMPPMDSECHNRASMHKPAHRPQDCAHVLSPEQGFWVPAAPKPAEAPSTYFGVCVSSTRFPSWNSWDLLRCSEVTPGSRWMSLRLGGGGVPGAFTLFRRRVGGVPGGVMVLTTK